MRTFTHSVKKTTELPCLGILKHGNYALTIRWMYVLSIDTPTSVGAQPERYALAVARINRLVLAKWGKERACAVPVTTIPRCFRVWNPLKQRWTLKKKKYFSALAPLVPFSRLFTYPFYHDNVSRKVCAPPPHSTVSHSHEGTGKPRKICADTAGHSLWDLIFIIDISSEFNLLLNGSMRQLAHGQAVTHPSTDPERVRLTWVIAKTTHQPRIHHWR